MLKQRVVTALIMASLFLGGVYFLPLRAVALIFVLVVVLGAWEWAPMAGLNSAFSRFAYVLLVAAGTVGLYYYADFGAALGKTDVQPVVGFACLWWCFSLLWVKSYPASAAIWGSRVGRALMGMLVLLPAWFAALFLLQVEPRGVVMIVLVLVVAAADIGAYFAGRAFGKHALSPDVSPGKTWEGFWGGVVAVAILAAVLWSLLPTRFDHLSLSAAIVVALATAFASVLGDLTVSMVKRRSGFKDSSSLLPGHGGVLDRLDSLCAAAPTFALSLLLVGF